MVAVDPVGRRIDLQPDLLHAGIQRNVEMPDVDRRIAQKRRFSSQDLRFAHLANVRPDFNVNGTARVLRVEIIETHDGSESLHSFRDRVRQISCRVNAYAFFVDFAVERQRMSAGRTIRLDRSPLRACLQTILTSGFGGSGGKTIVSGMATRSSTAEEKSPSQPFA